MKKIKDFLGGGITSHKDIGEPPWLYDVLLNLPEKDYPRYLKKLFKLITGDNLNLKRPKTFNEKIQWLKLYDTTPLKTRLTDKVLVRDWVKEKIGEEYLKPLLWTGSSFDNIPFDTLPSSFIIKANHGCKWHFKIKDKEKFLAEKALYDTVKTKFNGWMSQKFFPWAGFEMQYKDINPQLLVEPLLVEKNEDAPVEVEAYCFNGKMKFIQKVIFKNFGYSVVFDEEFKKVDFKFNPMHETINDESDEKLMTIASLSEKLASDFKLVRVDWLLYENKIYFNEMTFTPQSGFFDFSNKETNKKLGNLLCLK